MLGLECSRLARNNADWHRLLELCSLSGTLICDEDGLYDPGSINDRLLLGLKGTISEAELHFIRARLQGGLLAKAARGELRVRLPVGLVYDQLGNVALDPDAQVRGAVAHLFEVLRADRLGARGRQAVRRRAAPVPRPARPRRTARRRDLLEAAAPRPGAVHAAQPPLCRRVLLWATQAAHRHRRPHPHHRQAPRPVDGADPRRAPRIHHLRAVRAKPADACGERRRPRRGASRRARPRRTGAAARPRRLRQVRQADDRQLPHTLQRRAAARLPLLARGDRDRHPAMPDDLRRRRRPGGRQARARTAHPAGDRDRARGLHRARPARRARRPDPPDGRAARRARRRRRPPPLPRRRPDQPARRRPARSRLERQAARARRRQRRVRARHPGRQPAAHRRADKHGSARSPPTSPRSGETRPPRCASAND